MFYLLVGWVVGLNRSLGVPLFDWVFLGWLEFGISGWAVGTWHSSQIQLNIDPRANVTPCKYQDYEIGRTCDPEQWPDDEQTDGCRNDATDCKWHGRYAATASTLFCRLLLQLGAPLDVPHDESCRLDDDLCTDFAICPSESEKRIPHQGPYFYEIHSWRREGVPKKQTKWGGCVNLIV